MFSTLRPLSRLAVAWMICPALFGCRADTDVAVRYELEKEVWKAKRLETRVAEDPLVEDRRALRAAASLYETVLGTERFHEFAGGTSDASRDIRELLLGCRIALTEIYYLEFKDMAGVTYPATISGRHDWLVETGLGLRLEQSRALYGTLDVDSLEVRCADALQRVGHDPSLMLAEEMIGDTLLAIPIHLARVQHVRGDARPYDYARAAEAFYSRIIDIHRGARIADEARRRRVDLYTLERRFADAITDLDSLLAAESASSNRGELLLYKGQILAHGLDREVAASELLEAAAAEFLGTHAGAGAVLELSFLALRRGQRETGARLLRDLELNPATPRETAAAAIFLRALDAQRSGDRAEAAYLLGRLRRLEPYTLAAAVSPWLTVRHALESGDAAAIDAALEEANEYYLDAIARHVGYLEHPFVLQDFFIEAYLIAGRPRDAAELLESQGVNWRVDIGCVALYKSALIYLNLLNDRTNGIRLLQKCLATFPNSRYHSVVRAHLLRVTEHGDEL